jgi:hypothetical protein
MFNQSKSTNEDSISKLTALNNTLPKSVTQIEMANDLPCTDYLSKPETNIPDHNKIVSKNLTTNSETTNPVTNHKTKPLNNSIQQHSTLPEFSSCTKIAKIADSTQSPNNVTTQDSEDEDKGWSTKAPTKHSKKSNLKLTSMNLREDNNMDVEQSNESSTTLGNNSISSKISIQITFEEPQLQLRLVTLEN